MGSGSSRRQGLSRLLPRALGIFLVCLAVFSSVPAWAHRSGPVGPTTGLSIPTLTHGQMAVINDHFSDIIDLADRQIFTDETFRRYRNYITLQYTACLWGMVPASLTDEDSPFNECSHGYLSGARTLLLYMKTMPKVRAEASALADRISLEMLAHNASLIVCRYSDEPFNTADVVFPHWSAVPFHAPSLFALLGAALLITGFPTLGFLLLLRGPHAAAKGLAAGV